MVRLEAEARLDPMIAGPEGGPSSDMQRAAFEKTRPTDGASRIS